MVQLGQKPQLLVAKGISKVFRGTQALAGADFELREREIHGLLGASGAGKSTLCSIIAGRETFDTGEMTYRGYPIKLRSARDALRIGIAIVTQAATSLVPDLTVIENIFLPEFGRPGRLDYSGMRTRGRALLESFGQGDAVPLDVEVRRLSFAQMQLVEIAKALAVRAKLMIFDEPTSALSATDVDRLLDVLARLRLSGRGLVFVSRRLDEIYAVTDRFTVLREGRTVLSAQSTSGLDRGGLVRAMNGAEGKAWSRIPQRPATSSRTAPLALEVRKLAAGDAVRDVSFGVGRGEILGLAGLRGAGRSEAVEAAFGLRERDAGTVRLDGRPLGPGSPRAAIAAGMGFVAGNGEAQGVMPDFSVMENLRLPYSAHGRGVALDNQTFENKVAAVLRILGIPADRLPVRMGDISGSHRKLVLVARWLLLDPRVLILDEPTSGLDEQARLCVHTALRDFAARGAAVVIISNDFDELLALSDRVVVVRDGLSVADLPAALLDEAKLTLLATPCKAMARNTALLEDLTKENGGAGFWALIEGDQIICLNTVVSEPGCDPGLKPGEAHDLSGTRIPEALRHCEPIFVPERDTKRSTMLVPLRSRHGQDLGWIGLSLTPNQALPPPAAIKFRIDTLAASL